MSKNERFVIWNKISGISYNFQEIKIYKKTGQIKIVVYLSKNLVRKQHFLEIFEWTNFANLVT